MNSYLIDELQIDPYGIAFKKELEFRIISWKRILTEEWNFDFKEKFLFLSSNSTIPFYWVELIPPNPNFTPIKIHFPKGLSQQEDFKNLVAYYLLKKSNLLETLADDNNQKANDFIKKNILIKKGSYI